MASAKIRQRVIIDRHPAADPLISDMALAQPRQRPRAAHSVNRRIKPQRHRHLRAGRGMTRPARARLDRVEHQAQIQLLDKRPRRTRRVIQQPPAVQADRAKAPAAAAAALQSPAAHPRPAPASRFGYCPLATSAMGQGTTTDRVSQAFATKSRVSRKTFTSSQIDTDTERWLQCRQKVTGSATEIEHACARRDKKSHVLPILVIIGTVFAHPNVALARYAIGMLADGAFALRDFDASAAQLRYDIHDCALRKLSDVATDAGVNPIA